MNQTAAERRRAVGREDLMINAGCGTVVVFGLLVIGMGLLYLLVRFVKWAWVG